MYFLPPLLGVCINCENLLALVELRADHLEARV